MSGVVNIKSGPRGPSSSGIPLPTSLLPSSPKTDPRRRGCDLPKPSTQTKHTPTHTPSHSPALRTRNSAIPGSSSRNHLRDSGLKSQLLQRTGTLPVPQVSRSAYSSPLTQRRVPPPHSKDTLDLGKPTPACVPSELAHNGNRNRSTFTNKNQAWGASNLRLPLHFRDGDNSDTAAKEAGQVIPSQRGESAERHLPQAAVVNNDNIRPAAAQSSYEQTIRDRSDSASQSDEEMESPEDNSPASPPDPLPLPFVEFADSPKSIVDAQDHNKHKEAANMHVPRVNMATVAPFSYR